MLTSCLWFRLMLSLVMVVDVKTTEADVIAYYISFYWLMLLPIIVADVITTCYSMRRCLLMAGVIAIYMCGRCYNH